MTTFRHGALYVVQQASDKDSLTKDLKAIDPRFFFEKQVAFDGQEVWCVCLDLSQDGPHGVITFFEWRDEDDNAIPDLTSAILDRVRRMERDPRALMSKILAANEERKQRAQQDYKDQMEQMARDYFPYTSGKRLHTAHKGQHIRLAHDKLRRRGINI